MEAKPATGNGLNNDTEPTKLIAALVYRDGTVRFDIDEGITPLEVFGVAEMLRQWGIDEFANDDEE